MKDFEPETFEGRHPGGTRADRRPAGHWKPYVYRGNERDDEFSIRCGTPGGYNWHIAHGEKPDQECEWAFRDQQHRELVLARVDQMIEQAHRAKRTEARKKAPSYPYRKVG